MLCPTSRDLSALTHLSDMDIAFLSMCKDARFYSNFNNKYSRIKVLDDMHECLAW